MRLKGSKNKEKPDQSIIEHRYLVTYFMKRTQKFGDQGRHTEIVKGDLEAWFIERATSNPEFTILIENSQYIYGNPSDNDI